MGLLKGDTGPSLTTPTITSAGGFNAILDRGSEFEGKLTFEGTVRIDGKFKGEIYSDANLVIGESGKVEANINVGSISISGDVKGNITARTKVEIHPPAVVHGNIQTPSLIIEEGSLFEGNCLMEKTASTTKKVRTEAVIPPPEKRLEDQLR
ncbi:MAG: polymer-forming cytoskeletal protein [Pseudomonadota bacterium]